MTPRNTVPVLLALCLAAACSGAPDDPAERIDQIRARYEAKLNGFAVDQVPVADEVEMAAMGEEGEAMAPDEGGEDGDETMEATEAPAEVPVRQDVLLDILLSHESREPLPGITVDIEHVGPEPDRAVKGSYRAYLDSSDLHRGVGMQISYRLEDVDYQEGDGFHVEVRHPIPPGERGEYREFQESGEGSS